jgi:hypothetical protein
LKTEQVEDRNQIAPPRSCGAAFFLRPPLNDSQTISLRHAHDRFADCFCAPQERFTRARNPPSQDSSVSDVSRCTFPYQRIVQRIVQHIVQQTVQQNWSKNL